MINLSENKRMNLLLGLTIFITSVFTTNPTLAIFSVVPKNPTARIIAGALAIFIPSLILLYTKGTPQELKFKTKLDDTWHNCFSDWLKILKVWNVVLNKSEYKKLIHKRWIGTQLRLVDEETKEISKDREVAVTDTKLKCLPTGVCGIFDAYVLKQCKNIYDAVGNMEKIFIVYCILHGTNREKLPQLWFETTPKA